MKRRERPYRMKGENVLSQRLVITVTAATKRRVDAAALKADVPVTEFVRGLILEALEIG